jgi:hypothetical protein
MSVERGYTEFLDVSKLSAEQIRNFIEKEITEDESQYFSSYPRFFSLLYELSLQMHPYLSPYLVPDIDASQKLKQLKFSRIWKRVGEKNNGTLGSELQVSEEQSLYLDPEFTLALLSATNILIDRLDKALNKVVEEYSSRFAKVGSVVFLENKNIFLMLKNKVSPKSSEEIEERRILQTLLRSKDILNILKDRVDGKYINREELESLIKIHIRQVIKNRPSIIGLEELEQFKLDLRKLSNSIGGLTSEPKSITPREIFAMIESMTYAVTPKLGLPEGKMETIKFLLDSLYVRYLRAITNELGIGLAYHYEQPESR